MAVQTTDLDAFKPAVISDAVGNGGVISANEITTNTLNNVYPTVTDAERVAGVTRYRKVFWKNNCAEDISFEHSYAYLKVPSTDDSYIQLKAGTDTDTQAEADDYTSWAGVGSMNTTEAAGSGSIIVDYPITAQGVYDESRLKITEGATSEEIVVDGVVSWSGTQATITLATNTANSYTSAAIVSTMVDLGDIETSSSSWSETSSSGTYDESTYPLTLYNVGTVTDAWTLTFSSATAFAVSGAATGSVGAGTTAGNFKPANGASFYFELLAAGWGGTWANGETITWNTVHAAKAVWEKQISPAAATSVGNAYFTMTLKGESATTTTTTTTTTT